MRLPLFLAAVLALAACGDGDPSDVSADAGTPADVAPDGSLGSFTLQLAERDSASGATAEVSGFLPPPVPAGAFPTLDLADQTVFNLAVDETSVPDGFELKGPHFVYVEREPDGSFDKASVLSARTGRSHNYTDTPYARTVGAFTFPPLWPDGASAADLTFDTSGDDDPQPIGTVGMSVAERPVWVQPVTLPPVAEQVDVTAEIDYAVDLGERPNLYLLYPQTEFFAGEPRWDMTSFYPDFAINGGRDRDAAATSSRVFTTTLRELGEGPTQAFLMVFPD